MNHAIRTITRVFITNPPTIFFILAVISFLVGADDWTKDLLWVAILLQIGWIFIKILAYLSTKLIKTSQPHPANTKHRSSPRTRRADAYF